MHSSRTPSTSPKVGYAARISRSFHDSSAATPAETFGNFDLVRSFKLNYADVRVSRWRSRVTGLSVVHLDYEAPIVDGYLAVRTEIFNDSGCPHTLEHLVFMGSEKYPYKGIIDHFANRGFSNGTNAWTDTDNTVYTVSTAGGQGFLQLLPIYVDHILYPTMTKAAFITEVHHIDGKGEDSGVVYSEMQGRQNTAADLMSLEYQRLVNPEGSAYRSETAGLMQALRKLTVEQIREYHASYYVPHNLSIIVNGKLSGGTESLLRVVQEQVEPSIIAHGQDKGPRPPGWKRPFLETASVNRPPLERTIETVVEFPEHDETVGELLLGYMGPAVDQHLERKALDILSTYLTSSSVAPLSKEFIETDNPLCTDITFDEDTRATRCDLPVYISSVLSEYLDKFPGLLKDSLTRIADEGIDMKRMSMVLNRDKRQLISKLEHSKSDMFATATIEDFLLGPEDGSGMTDAFDELKYYDELQKWKSDDWAAILRKYYIDAPCAIIRGKPSSTLADRLEKEEKARIAKQVKDLGPEGLAEAQRELDAAKAEHEKPIPEEVLQAFPVPDVKSISWIPVQSVQEGTPSQTSPLNRYDNSQLLKHINSDGSKLPFFVEFDHVDAAFVTVYAFLSMEKVPNHLRKLIIIYLTSFFSLPVTRYNGEKLSHEELVHRLDDETVAYQIQSGTPSAFSETIRVSIKVEKEKYEEAIQWLRDLIYRSEFTYERLAVNLAKITQSLPELKRDGNTMMSSLVSALLNDESSSLRAYHITTMLETVPEMAKQLEEDPEGLVRDMETFREALTTPSGMRFSVAGDILSIPNPRAGWLKSFGDLPLTTNLDPVQYSSSTLSEVGKNPRKKAVIMGLPTIESSFVTHTCKSIHGFNHPEYPALRVAVEVLNATEGFLWRYIRGSGLAYGANLSLDLEAGHLSFILYRSSNSMQALAEGAKVVRGLVDGSIALEDSAIDSAKSAIVYSVTKRVATPTSAAVESFVNLALKQLSQTHTINLLSSFQRVTKSDILAALRTHVLPLFDAETSVAVVVTAPGKVQGTKEGLEKLGFEVEEREAKQIGVEEGEEGEEGEGSEWESGSEGGSGSDVSMR